MSALAALMQQSRERVEKALADALGSPSADALERLHGAMRYSVLGGGKRVRPLLVYAAGQALGVPASDLDAPASAVELIHAYSLVHDDLPAMDDDDLRRGRPTCHKAYDEATAILVGDALQTLAFQQLAGNTAVPEGIRLKMVTELAHASGLQGMVGGQAIDIGAVGQQLTLDQLQEMHGRKTGALIRASVRLGALAAPALSSQHLNALDTYADAIGLAFQVQDDILDVEGEEAVIGKPKGSDAESGKPTYTSLLGLDGARAKANELHRTAVHALECFDERADALRELATFIIQRTS